MIHFLSTKIRAVMFLSAFYNNLFPLFFPTTEAAAKVFQQRTGQALQFSGPFFMEPSNGARGCSEGPRVKFNKQ